LIWAYILAFFFFLVFYFSLVLIWLLLGAIVNPQAFLPYATAGATFLTMMATKAA
jgi:hypothetical protein